MAIKASERARSALTAVVRKYAPLRLLRGAAEAANRRFEPPVGRVRFGSFDQTSPVNGNFGYGRGRPVDRWYVENFLGRHTDDITGRVLEVKDDGYTRRFGGHRVEQSDVVDIDGANTSATIVADISKVDSLPQDTFDCVILTQTLHLIFDMHSAVATLHRALRPGGVLLITVPGISQVHQSLADTWFWSLTEASVDMLLGSVFGGESVAVETHGNVLAATAFLQGLGADEVGADGLAVVDAAYPVIVAARAVKSTS